MFQLAPVGKADGVGGGEDLFGHEQLRRLVVVTANLIYPQGNCLVLAGVLALNHQHRHTIDEKNDILPRAVVTVVKSEFLGNFVHIAGRIVVINQDQVALALLLLVRVCASIAQVFDEFLVAVDGGGKVAKLIRQRALGLDVVARLNSRTLVFSRPGKNSDRFLARSLGGAFGSNPRRCSASLRGTKVQPMASAYLRMRDWTVLCSPGFMARNVELPKCHRGFGSGRSCFHEWLRSPHIAQTSEELLCCRYELRRSFRMKKSDC